MRDLHAKREERPGEEEWTAMVLSLVAATLVQLPRAFVPMPRSEVKALVQKCYRHVTVALLRDYQDVSIDRRECIECIECIFQCVLRQVILRILRVPLLTSHSQT
jgi:NAD-dependent dihydropyrimidine dehydrogenase PreA subunit